MLKPIIATIVVSLFLLAPAAAGPFEDALAADNRGDYSAALALARPLAEQGDPRAQNLLGAMYSYGEGVMQDHAEAARWFRRSADQGLASGQDNLGLAYLNGWGVPKDDAEALRWFRIAADQGRATAQFRLGGLFSQGRGVPQDDLAAADWFLRSAEQGLQQAEAALGWIYSEGRGVPKDYVEAFGWFRKAADHGLVAAQSMVGNLYAEGRGVPQDYAEALRWFRKAADQGYAEAQYALGNMYAMGMGVPKDVGEAVAWYRKAGLGDAEAQYTALLLGGGGSAGPAIEAYSLGEVDLVQVAVALSRPPEKRPNPPTLPPNSPDAPLSSYPSSSDTHVRDIRDPEAIAKLIAFVNARVAGWHEAADLGPIPHTQLRFLRGDKIVGTFAVGANFFSRGNFPDMIFLWATPDEQAEIYALAHIQ